MAVFTLIRAFDDATPVRCCAGRPIADHLPAIQTSLVASWRTDADGRLIQAWRRGGRHG